MEFEFGFPGESEIRLSSKTFRVTFEQEFDENSGDWTRGIICRIFTFYQNREIQYSSARVETGVPGVTEKNARKIALINALVPNLFIPSIKTHAIQEFIRAEKEFLKNE